MKKPLILAIIMICGCATFQTKETATNLGMRVLSDVEISQDQISLLDENLTWAQTNGLKGDPKTLTLIIKACEQRPSGAYGFKTPDSPTGWAGAETFSCDPVMIRLCPQELQFLRHEFLHVILFQKTGDSDATHSQAIWKELGQF